MATTGSYEASHGYFGTSPSRLTLAQSALLAALPNAPSYLDPYTNYKRGKGATKTRLRTNGRPRHDYTSGSGLCIPTRIRACGRVM